MESFPKALFPSQTSFMQMEECFLEPEEQNYQCPLPEYHLCSFLETSVNKSRVFPREFERRVMAQSHFWSEIPV